LGSVPGRLRLLHSTRDDASSRRTRVFRSARPSDVQVLTLFNGCVHDDRVHHGVVQKLIDQLDWKAIQAIVR